MSKVKRFFFRNRQLITPLIAVILILLALELIVSASGISENVFPAPSKVFKAMFTNWSDIAPHFLFSAKVICLGFAIGCILGILLAAVCSQFDLLVKAIYPYLVFFVVTPMITLVPLMVLWLGTDPNLRIIIVIAQATPIIMLNTLSGFTNVETAKLELARSMGASRLQTFVKIIFPNALPQVFTGVKLGCVFSTIAAITADFASLMRGLGYKIINYTKYVMTDMVFASIILIAVIGLVLFYSVSFVEKRVIVWKK